MSDKTRQGYPKVDKRIGPLVHQLPRVMPSVPGDPGTNGRARGPLEVAQVPTIKTVDAEGRTKVHNSTVVQGKQQKIFKRLSDHSQWAMTEYAGLVERRSAVGIVELGCAVDGGKLSDGGVVGKLSLVQELDRVRGYLRPFVVNFDKPRSQAVPIRVEYLVEAVVIDRKSIWKVMEGHGWRNDKGLKLIADSAFVWAGERLQIAFGVMKEKPIGLPDCVRMART